MKQNSQWVYEMLFERVSNFERATKIEVLTQVSFALNEVFSQCNFRHSNIREK